MAENKDNQDLGDSLPDGDRGLGDLLGAFMGASGGSGGDSADMLGSLMGGLMGSGDASAGGMEDLLGGLMGGTTPTGGTTSSPSSSSTGGLDLDAMLGSAGSAPSSGSAVPSAGGLGDLLGGLMGGGTGGASGGMGGLLGGLLGGMAGGGQTDSFGGGGGAMLPFAGTLSEKLGISPQMANALIGAAMGLIMSKLTQQRQGDRSAEGLTMNSLMDPDFLRSSGVAAQVAQQTGMDEDEAIRGLQEAISLAGQESAKPSSGSQSQSSNQGTDLKGLLDSWD